MVVGSSPVEKTLFCNLIMTLTERLIIHIKAQLLHLIPYILLEENVNLLEKKEIHGNTEYEKSSTENFAWGLTRYAASDWGSQIVPSWTGFQKLIYPNKNTKVSVGYLPPITAPPTEVKVIFSVINRSLDVMTELNLKNIILEADQAIYIKILDAMFRMERDI